MLEQHLQEIERLEREAEIERFAHALAADAILPEDFGVTLRATLTASPQKPHNRAASVRVNLETIL